MFEDLITQLDSLGVEYIEDYDAGTLTVPVDNMNKIQLIEVINIVNNSGMMFNIDDASLVISGGELTEEPVEDVADEDMVDAAMNEALGYNA